MICPECKTETAEGARFCGACGQELTLEGQPTVPDLRRPEPAVPEEPHLSGPLQPGQKIADRYRVVSLLGRGGMGEVYRADDLHLGQSVALKFIPRRVAADPLTLDRFKKEVRTARAITHPNVCRIHDFGEAEGRAFLSMEYVDGEDLASVIKRLGRPTKEKAIEIARQICLGLAAVHETGVIHRDLKPSNIMIDGRGNVRLVDFGIAGLQQDDHPAAGTVNYMAPELFKGGRPSSKADIYSLGLVLYEVFTGKRAFQGNVLPHARQETSTTSLTTPSSVVEDMDPLVERAILRCLETDPEERPDSVYTLLRMLPGGDPLAAAMAAGQTPSPEMVAAAGDSGVLSQPTARVLLAAILAGLFLICWLAGSTYEVNQVEHWKHPEVLAQEARSILRDWGYDSPPGDEAFGFYNGQNRQLGFWYRRTSGSDEFLTTEFYSDWGEHSLCRTTHQVPTFKMPGELGVRLDLSGRLVWFRALPERDPNKPKEVTEPRWSEWFSEEVIGYDLDALTKVADKEVPPPDAYDELQVWKGVRPRQTNEVYLEAAAYRGRPIYFDINTPEEFESSWNWRDTVSERVRMGRDAMLYLYLCVLIASAIMASRNFRSGRSDRKGGFRVACFLFGCGMLAWLFLAHHVPSGGETAIVLIGTAQALLSATVFWAFYTALEPFVRRVWPQTLVSWSRLVAGRWRDPLVGRDSLVGVLAGIVLHLLAQVEVLAPRWLGLSPQPYLVSPVRSIDGVAPLIGFFLDALTDPLGKAMFLLLILMCLRSALKKTVLVWGGFLVIMTPIIVPLQGHHPVIGWVVAGMFNLGFLWVIRRFGFLSVAGMMITGALLRSPISGDFSAWYASHGLIAVGLLAAVSGLAYSTSQGRRP